MALADMRLAEAGETRVISNAGGDSQGYAPDIAQLVDGRIVVVWNETIGSPTDAFSDTDGAVFGRLLDDQGRADGEIFQVNSYEPFLQGEGQVAALPFGGFAVTYSSTAFYFDAPPTEPGQELSDYDGWLQYFDANGVIAGDLFEIAADVAPDSGQKEIFGMEAINGSTLALLYGDAIPARLVDNFGLFSGTLAGAPEDLVQLTNGNIFIAYQGGFLLSDPSFDDPIGIGTVNDPVVGRPLVQPLPTDAIDIGVAALSQGGMVSAYSFVEPETEGPAKIDVRVFSPVTELESAFVIDHGGSTDPRQNSMDILGLSGGGFILAYEAEGWRGIANQHLAIDFYDEDGVLLNALTIGADDAEVQTAPTLLELQDGRIAVSYEDFTTPSNDGESGNMQIAFFNVEGDSGSFTGTEGDDTLIGVGGPDLLEGEGGADLLQGRGGADTLKGGAGNDTLEGQAGDDALRGNEGDDSLIGADGRDGLFGGEGADTLEGGSGADVLGGGADDDTLSGGSGNDDLRGHAGNDLLQGNNQKDRLAGWSGDDTLEGGNNADTLIGGRGNDLLEGGAGQDTFLFYTGRSDSDTITDYDAVLDSIAIELGDLDESSVQVAFDGTDSTVTFGEGGAETITVLNVEITLADIDFV